MHLLHIKVCSIIKSIPLKRTRGGGKGGGQGVGVTGVTGTEGALDGMSTGCYSICWQIEHLSLIHI